MTDDYGPQPAPADQWPATPPEVTAPSPESEPREGPDRVKVVAVVAAVTFAISSVLLGFAWQGAAADADRLRDTVEGWEQREAAAQAELDARPNLEGIADAIGRDDSGIDWAGDEDSLTVDIRYPGGSEMTWLETFMDDLGLQGGAVRDRMAQTRALDGTQEASSDKVTVTWTYHPDDGLSAVFSVDR